jgi:hypothetical protein
MRGVTYGSMLIEPLESCRSRAVYGVCEYVSACARIGFGAGGRGGRGGAGGGGEVRSRR